MPQISVVMPAYNHERYVGEAVQSVLGQSFSDLELIIVDDGSQDATGAVIASFNDPRIRYFYQENAGAHVAINAGLSQAQGRYLAILNSDDCYMEERLERLFGYAEEHGSRFLFTAVEHIDSGSRSIPAQDPRRAGYERLIQRSFAEGELLPVLLQGNISLTSSNFFLAKSVYEQVGLFADYRYAHDYDYLLRVAKACGSESVAMLPDRLVRYRRHGKNTISENEGVVALETYRILADHLPGFMRCDGDRRFAEMVLRPLLVRAGEEYAALTATRSWKATAPLRLLAEAVGLPPGGEGK